MLGTRGHGDLPREAVSVIDDLDLVEHVMYDLHAGRAGFAELELIDHTDASVLVSEEWQDPVADAAWSRRAAGLGMSFRYVMTPQLARSPDVRSLTWLAAREHWRVLPKVPLRLVVHNGLAMSSIDREGRRQGALVCQGEAARSWARYGEELWRQAKPWSPEVALRDHARHLAIVDLLLEGFDDEAVGRRLGISVRTVRRHVAELMAEHGVRGRLQLGAALVKSS